MHRLDTGLASIILDMKAICRLMAHWSCKFSKFEVLIFLGVRNS